VIEEGGPRPDGDLIEGILDINDHAAGLQDRRTDPVDIGDDVTGCDDFGDLARRHEAVLQIDYNMGSPLTNDAIEYP
jgi:hypothetical protein